MEKKKALDGRCSVSLGRKFHFAVRQRTGSRISRGTHPPRRENQGRRQTVPTAISVTGDCFRAQPIRGVFHCEPRRQPNLLCRSDWLCLRGIAETECAILPIRELAAHPRCSACEHLSSGERPSARRSLPAPVQPDPVPWSGSWSKADSPCSWRTDSIYDSDSEHWKLRREADAELSQSSASAQCLQLFLLFVGYRRDRM